MNIQEAMAAVAEIGAEETLSPETIRPEFTFDALYEKQEQNQPAKPVYPTPKTWFGEGTAGLARGGLRVKQMGVDLAGLATTGDWNEKIMEVSKGIDKDIEKYPASVPESGDVEDFDTGVRFLLGIASEQAPNIGVSVAAGGAGAFLGKTLLKSSIGGLIEKRAAANLIKQGFESGPLTEFVSGNIAKSSLPNLAKEAVGKEALILSRKYGAQNAVALNSWGMETANIYDDLRKNLDIPESERKVNALAFGLVAAIPEAGMQSYIASKFFPGLEVGLDKIQDAGNYASRFIKKFGVGLLTVAPAEGVLEEFPQTLIEIAAKRYSDPATRDKWLEFTGPEYQQAIEAMKQGMVVGGAYAGIGAVGGAIKPPTLNPSPNPEVRQHEADIETTAQDLTPPPPPTPEDIRASEILSRQDQINTSISDTSLSQEDRTVLTAENIQLEEEYNKLFSDEQEQESLVNEEKANEEEVIGFTTSKGSTYEVNGQSTRRNKTLHEQHDPKDVGVKEPSEITVYVDPETAREIGMWQTSNAKNKQIALTPEGELFLTSVNPYTEGASRGRDKMVSSPKYSNEPKVGLSPLELWKQDKVTGQFQRNHPGNPIVSLTTSKKSERTEGINNPKKESNSQSLTVNTSADLPSTEVDTISTAEGQLRAIYAQQLPNREAFPAVESQITPEQLIAKKTEIETLVNEIADEHRNTEEGKAYREEALKILTTPEFSTLAAENKIRFKKGKQFQVAALPGGGITVTLAKVKNLTKYATALASQSDFRASATSLVGQVRHIGSILTHETAHIADYIALRNEWKKTDKKKNFNEFTGERHEELGKIFKKASREHPQLFKQIEVLGKKVYDYAKEGELTDIQIGQEIPRMMVELARTGRIDEFTQALVQARAEAKDSKKKSISDFLKNWVESIKSIRDVLARFINNENVPQEILTAFNNMNKVLDKYGVLVNEDAKQKQQEIAKTKSANEDLKSETVDSAAEKANTAKSLKESARTSEEDTILAKTKGKPRDVKDEASKPSRSSQPESLRDPNDYVPALLEPSGNIILGQKGEFHRTIKARQTQEWRDENTVAEAMGDPVAIHGFVEIANPKVFLTREQVSEALGEKDPMQSERLLELQKKSKNGMQSQDLIEEASSAKSARPLSQGKATEIGKSLASALKLEEPDVPGYNIWWLAGKNKQWKVPSNFDDRPDSLSNPDYEYDKDDESRRFIPTKDRNIAIAIASVLNEPYLHRPTFTEVVEIFDSTQKGSERDIAIEMAIERLKRENPDPEFIDQFESVLDKYEELTGSSEDQSAAKSARPQIHTAKFKKWFGDWENDPENSSKVVDENGEPKIMYHGSFEGGFDTFRVGNYYGRETGIWVTSDKKGANEHAAIGDDPKTYAVFLNIRKPFLNTDPIPDSLIKFVRDAEMTNGDEQESQSNFLKSKKIVELEGSNGFGVFREWLIENGYDGFLRKNKSGDVAIALYPIQIKSATDNSGEFSTEDYSSAKSARPVSKRDQDLITEAERVAARVAKQVFGDITPKQSERKKVQGAIAWGGATPSNLYYATRTHTQSAVNAQAIVNEKGLSNVIEILEKDPTGRELDIKEDSIDGLFYGPDSTLAAVYENISERLATVENHLISTEASMGVLSDLRDKRVRIAEAIRIIINRGGSAAAYTGQGEKIWNGNTAVKEYINIVTGTADVAIGKEPQKKFSSLTTQLNNLWVKHSGVISNSPKIINLLRRLQKQFDKTKFAKGYRQALAKNIEKLKAVVSKSSARAAEAIGESEDAYAKADYVVEFLVKEMSGVPKEPNTQTESQVVMSALRSMTKETAQEMGLMAQDPKFTKLTQQQKFLAILKNEELFPYFAEKLREEYIKAYGTSPQVVAQAEALYQKTVNRLWTDGMVKSLVNEKLGQLGTRLSEIVKSHYSQAEYTREAIAADIERMMREEGVTNSVLVEKLTDDIEAQLQENINAARDRFFGSSKTVREFLKHALTSLSEAAKSHASFSEHMETEFAKTLVKYYYFPEAEAIQMAKLMQNELNVLVREERKDIVRRWIENLAKENPKNEKKITGSAQKILELANLGVMRVESVYTALQEKFGLPPYKEETANQIQELGDKIGASKSDRQKDELRQELSNLIASAKGLPTSSSYLSWMYFSMLSGISTHLVNLGGNTTNLMGYVLVEGLKYPSRIPRMMRAIGRAATGVGQLEARQAWFTGMQLGKDGNKFFTSKNPAELPDVFFRSGLREKLGDKVANADEATAKFVHNLIRTVKGNYVGRSLMATDIFFYKIAREMAYEARTGAGAVTEDMWLSAKQQAREDMLRIDKDPDTSKDNKREMMVKAHAILENLRLHDKDGNLVNEREMAWNEAHSEGLDATFNNEPKGWLGALAKLLEKFLETRPIGKMIIPFTRISAAVTNTMIEWTPFGFGRYLLTQSGNPFMLKENGQWKKESDVSIRAALGTAMIMVLFATLADEDEEDPDFTIYGGGPRDINKKRMLMEKGWKPNSIKIGSNYYSYLYTPVAMALSIVGRQMDDYRDGRIQNVTDGSVASTAIAMLDAVSNQSFLATVVDIMSAIDSPDPQSKVAKVTARFASIPIPNLVKQMDKFFDPSLQEAQSFRESIIKDLPMARWGLRPALNVFGEPIQRTLGALPIPGFERFITSEKTSDEVLNLLSEKNIAVPGFSKNTHLGDVGMTPEEYYRYVQIAGPNIKTRIQSELGMLRMMEKENIKDRLEKIATEEKKAARSVLLQEFPRAPR